MDIAASDELICINLTGKKFFVMLKNFANLPNSRLGHMVSLITGNLYSVSKLSKLSIKTECLQNLYVSIWKYLFPLSWAYTYLYLLAWQFSIEPSTSTQLSFNTRFPRFFEKSAPLTDTVSKTGHCHTKKLCFGFTLLIFKKKYSFNSDIYFKIQLFSKKCAKETVAWNNTFWYGHWFSKFKYAKIFKMRKFPYRRLRKNLKEIQVQCVFISSKWFYIYFMFFLCNPKLLL